MTLREAREKRGYSQQQLAAFTGLSQTVISSMERGVIRPTQAQALVLERTLNTPISWPSVNDAALTMNELRDFHQAFSYIVMKAGVWDALKFFHGIKGDNARLREIVRLTVMAADEERPKVMPYVAPTFESLEAAEKKRKRS